LNTKRTGDILRAAREARGESLQQVSQAIKIRVSMLQSIEAGKFFGLTDPLYLKGFIRAYAMHVGLDENEVMPFFRREYDEQQHQQQKLAKPLAPIESKKSKFTPGRIVIGVLTIAVLSLAAYSYNQYVSLALTPSLEITSPQDDITAENGQVEVSGKTDPDAQFTLNGQSVALTPEGEFNLTVAVSQGTNTLQFKSVNKLGKTTTVERTVIGPTRLAQNEAATNPTPTPGSSTEVLGEQSQQNQSSASASLKTLEITVVVGPSPVWLEVSADSKSTFSGLILPGATKVFKSNKEIKLKSGNAGSTRILLHGVDQGLMGEENEVVEKVYKK